MNNYTSDNSPKKTGLGQTIKQDYKEGDIFHSVKKDFKSLKEFYIDLEKKKRLDNMNPIERWFYVAWWILKGMILRLTPARRILLIIGIFFLFTSKFDITSNGDKFQTSINGGGVIGGTIILVVLMLELKDKLLAKDELYEGRKIQQALMPLESPETPGWSVWLFMRSANEVSGDLVDYIKINSEKNGFIIADVSGKGLKAALLTTKLQSTVRALASDFELPELVAKVNQIFHRDSLRNIFASLLFIELLSDKGELKFINAGHLPPILINSDGLQEMPKGEAALGIIKDVKYTENKLELNSGEVFIAYTDGITEARNENGFFYGSERFLMLLPLLKNKEVKEIGQAILSDVDKFSGRATTNDDISLIVIKKC